jgi:hypothetical protein
VTEAEVRHCAREELAGTVMDLWFRARVGMGPCHGASCALRAAQILAEERDLSPEDAREDVIRFLEMRWRDKLPVADGLELAQEELARATFLGMAGYGTFRQDDGG